MAAKAAPLHLQGIACPHCGYRNNASSDFEEATEKGYYIKTTASMSACQVCGKQFNFELELNVERVDSP